MLANPISKEQLQERLKQVFDFDSFRPGQAEAMQCLLERGSMLCIQPTGHGKSLLYQLPSTLLPGITVVISPLLALMRDQIQQLNQRFRIPAAAINSDQSEEENFEVRQMVKAGNIKVLFVAPEQLDHVDRFRFLQELPISLLVVDEAHCISTWGHDFRPSYRQIVQFAHSLCQRGAELRLLALTATADQRTEQDILEQLSITGRQIEVMRHSMNRPNIGLSVFQTPSAARKLEACKQLLSHLDGSGLIYCATRENTEIVADYLKQQGLSNSAAYHAGMDPEVKRRLQHAFLHDHYKVLAATNALGLGIDKSNLRFIIHFDIPGSITAYYQEVGRCGRDGHPARGILLYDRADRRIQEHFIESSLPKLEDFQAILEAVISSDTPPNLTTIKRATGLHPTRVTVVIAELVEQGFLEKDSVSGRQVYMRSNKMGEPSLHRYENQNASKNRELQSMLRYAEQGGHCRMVLLRQNLGDQSTEPCGNCSVCKREELSIRSEEGTEAWLSQRPIDIPAKKLLKMEQGTALLDGRQRTPLFMNFMRRRAQEGAEIEDDLLRLINARIQAIHQEESLAGIIVVPSRTWTQREKLAKLLGISLKIPIHLDLLQWQEQPERRQGELLNNDQRRFNVDKRMGLGQDQHPRAGTLLLLDDYTGSGATLGEAMRVLRKDAGLRSKIIPFTIAAVRWRLGRSGMV